MALKVIFTVDPHWSGGTHSDGEDELMHLRSCCGLIFLDIAVYKIDDAMKHAHAVFQTACILREDASLIIKCHRINVKETTACRQKGTLCQHRQRSWKTVHIGGKTNGELSTVACTSTDFKTTQPRRVSTTYNRAENNRSNIYSFLGPPSPHRIEFWLCLLSSRPNSFSLSLFVVF